MTPSSEHRLPLASLWLWGCVVVLLASRALAVLCPFELNVDESQMLAQAMRLENHPVPWLSMDGTTSGPVNSWVLLIAHWLTRQPFDYHLAHATAALVLAATLVLCHRVASRLFDSTAALAGTVSVTAWLGVNQHPDFLQFASELPSLLLLFAALAAGLGRDGRVTTRIASLVLAGGCLGLVPWAKLQAAPLAAAAGIWLWVGTLRAPVDRSAKLQRTGWLSVAAVLPSVVLLTWLVRAGAFEQFQRSYLATGLLYSGAKSLTEMLRDLVQLVSFRYVAPLFLAALVALGIVAWRVPRHEFRRALQRRAAAFALPALLLVASLLVCVKPLTQFPHYQLFLVFPAALVISGALCLARSTEHRRLAPLRSDAGMVLLLIALVVAQVAAMVPRQSTLRDTLGIFRLDPADIPQTRRAAIVRAAAPDARSLAVWGWEPSLYVVLQLPPSTRHAINHFLVLPGPHRQFLRETFLADLRNERPDILVTVAGGFFLPDAIDDAGFPEFDALVAGNYVLATRERLPDDSVVSVFRRKSPAP